MSNSNTTSVTSSDYEDGVAFPFELPSEDFSLRAVAIEDGVPKLHFSRYLKVPTITEEDVATCVRLCLDNKRPEFFYKRFHPSHPFAVTGRHYKHYKPAYLKGTSVGELLAEVDWKMKCLHVGVRSDESKSKFFSWPESSNLHGLKTKEDFPNTFKGSSQVFMSCESVDVCECEDTLSFVGEPKMKIKWFDKESSSPYSDYITNIYDSIAYHDEPDFLKMKEIVKLILAVEWLRDHGVKFSKEWVAELTNKTTLEPPKPLAVNVSEKESNRIMRKLRKEAVTALGAKPLTLPALTDSKYSSKVSVKKPEKRILKTGFELKHEETVPSLLFEALCDLYVPEVNTVTARVTLNDFDFLCQGIDPNLPVSIDPDSKEWVTPGVQSWSDLFRETMPFPCIQIQHPTNPDLRTPAITGGVTTSNIPIHHVPKGVTPAQVLPQVPPTNVGIDTSAARGGGDRRYGWTDNMSSSASTKHGDPIEQQPCLYARADVTSSIGGREVGNGRVFASFPLPSVQTSQDAGRRHVGELYIDRGEILLPPKSTIMARDNDSGFSSMASTPRSRGSPP